MSTKGAQGHRQDPTRKRKENPVPIDHLLPVKRLSIDPGANVPLTEAPMRQVALKPGSKLAIRFPQHVQGVFTDQRLNRC